MDKLAKQLRDDANKIDCLISDELDQRIRASLEGVKPEVDGRSRLGAPSPAFWWASSLTGAAAAVALIVLINSSPESTPTMTEPAPQPLVIPSVRWRTETAVLTSPLEQEMDDLQSDLRKAEEAVRQDIERLF
jgi:hypothetical protein